MRILKCEITNFGCFTNRVFDFNNGLNSFCLSNGEGKTTLAVFIKAMFYSLEKTSYKSFERKHYKPYSGGKYGGSIEIELNKTIYKIEREFFDSPYKDVLRIFNAHGTEQAYFLSKKISEMQGEESGILGELIFGIDREAFKRCNFISRDDLDFLSNESIKMKIGNIVIDRDRENSYEDTLDSIRSFDLRDKAPTARKNENAYPYKIKVLERENRKNNDEIRILKQSGEILNELYEKESKIKDELKEIERKQKEYSKFHVKKGQLSVIEQLDSNIQAEDNIIETISAKFNGRIPSSEQTVSLQKSIEEYENYDRLEKNYSIEPSNVEKLKNLDGKIISDEDYNALLSSENKIENNNSGNGLIEIDLNKFEKLKTKFSGKSIKNELALQNEYINYMSLSKRAEQFSSDDYQQTKDLPSENVLKQIDRDITAYNKINSEISSLKAAYKEPSLAIRILLTIITFGIYSLLLRNKRKNHNKALEVKTSDLVKIASGLDSFFAKYDKTSGSYELRLAELYDDISHQESFGSKGMNEQLNKIKNEISEKRNALLLYFASFGYPMDDIDNAYNLYKNDLKEYTELSRDVARNTELKNSILNSNAEERFKIDNILKKYNLTRNDNFKHQLSELKNDIDFFKKYNPIYLNKCSADKSKSEFEGRITATLDSYKIQFDNNPLVSAKSVISDVNNYNNSKQRKADLLEKKANFIKENGLEGFSSLDVDGNEEELRQAHEAKNNELSTIEDQIIQNERNVSKIETIQDQIDRNDELIKDYNEKVRIAELAAQALESAQINMESKYISPIKDSFVSYASKIYKKIGSNVKMDYDYEIKYDVNGQMQEAKNLSEGEKTIMMLALRFAVLDSMYANHDSLIVLDDPFESLDSEKLSKAKDLLKTLSNDWQIIYFTCHESRKISDD